MKQIRLLALQFILCGTLNAQQLSDTTYTADYLDRSTRFAWTTLGGDLTLLPGGHIELPNRGRTDFGPTLMPRLTIGGIHFWGHADFYVTFPLPLRKNFSGAPFESVHYAEGIETGGRVYPWRLRAGTLRPYVGISFKPLSYGHALPETDYEVGFPRNQRFVGPVQAGLTYATPSFLFTGGIHLLRKRNFQYAITPEQETNGAFHALSFTLGVVRYWDLDSDARTERGVQQENLKHHLLEKNNKMSAFYWAIGPSAALQLGKSPYLKNQHPALYRTLTGGFMLDVALGYHWARPDLNVGLSYRFMGDEIRAFDTRLRLQRHSFMLEAYKFLFNYLGFVPYAGVTLSMENLRLRVNDRQTAEQKPALGLIAGWDIRVTRTGSSLLRTNLRYIPGLALTVEGERMRFDHLEFNFIQYVRYIGRERFYGGFRRKQGR